MVSNENWCRGWLKWNDLVTWRRVFFTKSSHFTISLIIKFIYVCQLWTLHHSANSILYLKIFTCSLSLSYSYSRPLWNSEIHLVAYISELCSGAPTGHCMGESAAVGLLLGCGCGPDAELWQSGWIWARSSVGWGLSPLPVMIWWSSDAALSWQDLWCSNAPHTPSSRCEADAVIQHLRALHFSCAIGFSVSCV